MKYYVLESDNGESYEDYTEYFLGVFTSKRELRKAIKQAEKMYWNKNILYKEIALDVLHIGGLDFTEQIT